MNSSTSDLFLAVLSMDSCNRGYSQDIGLDGDVLGCASITTDSERVFRDPNAKEGTLSPAADAGFYAAAYTLTEAVDDLPAGTIVISCRGTNDLKDVWTDIQTITGVVGFPEQFRLAAKFYQAVKAANPGANIVLTGHSLGGALAGFVGSLYGVEAWIFDNMPFEKALDCMRAIAARTDADEWNEAGLELLAA